MSALRAVARLLGALAHVAYGLLVVWLYFPRLAPPRRAHFVRDWNATMLRRLGIALVVDGQFRPGAKLVVANHVSWLDILAINAVEPVRFVSKSEVGDWPVLGRLVSAAGTLYIERARARDAVRVAHHMAEALRAGDTVTVFPEGTTSDGHGLLPFHANLFQAAIATSTPVQPVALRYRDARQAVSAAAAYVGDTSLLQSVWQVVRATDLTAHVRVLTAAATTHADRRTLARHMQDAVGAALSDPLPSAQPAADPAPQP